MNKLKQVFETFRGVTLLAGLGLVMPVAALAQSPGPASMTLDEAIARAMDRSPAMLQQLQSVDNAEQANRQAWGNFLPGVNASSGASLRSTQRFDQATDRIVQGSSDSYSAGLSASLTLFDGGRMFSDLKGARADLRAAQAREGNQRAQVTLQTKNLFFAALRQMDLLEVAKERVRQADESLSMVRTRAQVGRATMSDTLRARLEMVNAQQAVLQAQTSTRAAQYALGRQVGVEGPVAPTAPADLTPTPLALSDEEIMQIAVAQAPAVIAAEESATAAATNVSSAKASYLPSISLSSGYNWANQAASLANGTTSWSLSFRASYPIFNGFQREAGVQRAEFSLRLAKLQEEDARLAARVQADGALQDLKTADQAITIAQEALAVAQEDLRVVRERYRVGVATILDLVTSQISVVQAGANVVTARYDYVLARARLEAVLGRGL